MEEVHRDLQKAKTSQRKVAELFGLLTDLAQVRQEEAPNPKLQGALVRYAFSSELKRTEEYLRSLEMQQARIKRLLESLDSTREHNEEILQFYREILKTDVVVTGTDRDEQLEIDIIKYSVSETNQRQKSPGEKFRGEVSECGHTLEIGEERFDLSSSKQKTAAQGLLRGKLLKKG